MLPSRSSVSDQPIQIAELSDEFMVRRVHDHWLIVGPTGLFVVGRSGDDVADTAKQLLDIAQRLRSKLAQHMAWVPFVDVLMVGDQKRDDVGCSVVRPSMLQSVVGDGHRRMELATLYEARKLLPRLAQDLTSEFTRTSATA